MVSGEEAAPVGLHCPAQFHCEAITGSRFYLQLWALSLQSKGAVSETTRQDFMNTRNLNKEVQTGVRTSCSL